MIALGVLVDIQELWETVVAATVAGVGITATFSLMIFGAARYADATRNRSGVGAVAAGALAIASLFVTAGAVVLGIIVMTTK